MSFLIDTSVISEVRKGNRCNPSVAAWWQEVDEADLFLSPLVLGEIRKGVELARVRDPQKAEVLERWLLEIHEGFSDRLLPVDGRVADEWGRMNAVRPVPVIDGLLAATAKVNRLTLVTRNEADMTGLGAEILNPFGRGWCLNGQGARIAFAV